MAHHKRHADQDIHENMAQMRSKVDDEKRGRVKPGAFSKLFKLLQFNMTTQQATSIFDAIDGQKRAH